LMDAAYGETIYVDDRTIDSHIKRVRRKFRGRYRVRADRNALWHRIPIPRLLTLDRFASSRSSSPIGEEESEPGMASTTHDSSTPAKRRSIGSMLRRLLPRFRRKVRAVTRRETPSMLRRRRH